VWRSGGSATATIYAATAGRVFGALSWSRLGLVSMLAGQGLGELWFVVVVNGRSPVDEDLLSARRTRNGGKELRPWRTAGSLWATVHQAHRSGPITGNRA
jgi:hypothetical protein